MTDDWLKENDKKKSVGAVLWGFNAAFDIIDHNLLLKLNKIKKLKRYGFSTSAILCIQRYYI